LRYLEGQGVPKDRVKGIEYIKKAAAQGKIGAINKLKELGEDAQNTTADAMRASANSTPASVTTSEPQEPIALQSAGSIEANSNEGNKNAAETSGRMPSDESVEQAIKTFQSESDEKKLQTLRAWIKNSETGDVASQFNLGNLYYGWCIGFLNPDTDTQWEKSVLKAVGFDVSRTDKAIRKQLGERAIQLITRVAEKGSAYAQVFLGHVFVRGDIVPENREKATEWFRKAAMQGDMAGQSALGGMLYLNRQFSESLKWEQRAAEQGDGAASVVIAQYYAIEKNDGIEAYRWTAIAASQGDTNASHILEQMRTAKSLTPAQTSDAERRTSSFKLSNPP
jgi:TPR repeat protein